MDLVTNSWQSSPALVAQFRLIGIYAAPFDLQPGEWTVSVKLPNEDPMAGEILVDYFVLVPNEYYEPTLLKVNWKFNMGWCLTRVWQLDTCLTACYVVDSLLCSWKIVTWLWTAWHMFDSLNTWSEWTDSIDLFSSNKSTTLVWLEKPCPTAANTPTPTSTDFQGDT